MKAKEVNETLDFERGQDPKTAMSIGILHRKWREDHDGKIIFTYFCYVVDPFKNKYTYWTHLYYSTKNESQRADTVYFHGEGLIDNWRFRGTPFSLSNMQNKPVNMFTKEEATFWDKPEVFNKIIDQLLDPVKAKIWFYEMTEEWFEDKFESMMIKWFNSGVYRIDHTELKFKG